MPFRIYIGTYHWYDINFIDFYLCKSKQASIGIRRTDTKREYCITAIRFALCPFLQREKKRFAQQEQSMKGKKAPNNCCCCCWCCYTDTKNWVLILVGEKKIIMLQDTCRTPYPTDQKKNNSTNYTTTKTLNGKPNTIHLFESAKSACTRVSI